MLFTRALSIALFDADYFDLHTRGMMSYLRHVQYGNDPLDELNTTVYAALREKNMWTKINTNVHDFLRESTEM